MNTESATATALAKAVAADMPEGVDVGIAPPFVYIERVKRESGPVLVGAQDVHHEEKGAFTGEVSVGMLRDVGCDFVIVGHSERRHVIHEPTNLIAAKAAATYNGGLILVHCVGETLEEREADNTLSVIEQQLAELTPAIDDPARLVIAYEPVWAIGTGKVATTEQAQEVHAFIRKELAESWNEDFASKVRIQYGGSVKPENCRELFGCPDIDGALVGGASLKSETFLPICDGAIKEA
jgi:triosephosphate isomerase